MYLCPYVSFGFNDEHSFCLSRYADHGFAFVSLGIDFRISKSASRHSRPRHDHRRIRRTHHRSSQTRLGTLAKVSSFSRCTVGWKTMKSTRRVLGHSLLRSLVRSHRSLTRLLRSLARSAALICSLIPELIGRRFLSMKRTRRFYTISNHNAICAILSQMSWRARIEGDKKSRLCQRQPRIMKWKLKKLKSAVPRRFLT